MTMRRTRFAIASVATAAILLASAVQAQQETIAGWDFSQYFSDGLLTTDGTTTTNTLPANYSVLDTTHNAGSESAAFGTATLGSGVVPTAGSLESNSNAPAKSIGQNGFESFPVLKAEGQQFRERMALTSPTSASVTFEADATSAGGASNWSVSFAGKALSGSGTVGVEYAPDGGSFSSFGTVGLTGDDQAYVVALGSAQANTGRVRLNLNPGVGQLVIDDVAVDAIPAPEPGAAIGLLVGAVSLVALRRLRA
jgi:hypothetical protein